MDCRAFLMRRGWKKTPLCMPLARPGHTCTGKGEKTLLYRFKGFDKAARRVLNEAVSTAASFGHAAAGTEHCLLAILREDEGEAAAFLLSRKIYGFRLARLICEEKGQNTPC